MGVIHKFVASKGEKPMYKAFNAMELTDEDFKKILTYDDIIWDDHKRLLKHRCCPLWLAKKFGKSDKFYERIVAFVAYPNRKHMISKGLSDSDNRVKNYVRRVIMNDFLYIISKLEIY